MQGQNQKEHSCVHFTMRGSKYSLHELPVCDKSVFSSNLVRSEETSENGQKIGFPKDKVNFVVWAENTPHNTVVSCQNVEVKPIHSLFLRRRHTI